MKKLAQFLMSLGSINFSKNGKGLTIYNPKSFDLAKLNSLVKASKRGFMVIHSSMPTLYQGRMVEPNLYVGPPKVEPTTDDMLARLEAME